MERKIKLLVIVGCFWQQALALGFIYFCFGMFTQYIKDDFGISNTQTSLTNSIAGALTYGAGPLAQICLQKLGYRLGCLIFGSLASFSVIAASLTHSYAAFLTLVGIVCGFSACVILYASSCVIAEVFHSQRTRQLAYGICAAGIGLGNMAFPTLVTYCMTQFTWRQALFLCGAVMLHFIPAAMLMPKRLTLTGGHEPSTNEPDASIKAKLHRNPILIVFMTAFLAHGIMCSSFYTFLSPFLLHNSIRPAQVGFVYMLIGVASCISRLLVVPISPYIKSPLLVWAASNIGCVLLQLVLYPWAQDYLRVCVICFCISFVLNIGQCLYQSIITSIVCDVVHVKLAFSIAGFVFGIAGLIGPLFTGVLADWFEDYVPPLVILSCVLFLSVVILVALNTVKQCNVEK